MSNNVATKKNVTKYEVKTRRLKNEATNIIIKTNKEIRTKVG